MSWRNWNIEDWNLALVNHLFLWGPEDAGPVEVRHLPVTDELFRKASQEPDENPQVLRDGFYRALRNGLNSGGSARSLMADARRRRDDWNPLDLERVPPFFAHLFAVCCAAALCEDLDEEVSVHANLRTSILQVHTDSYDQASFREFPNLLDEFARWTASNSDRYRVLVLPVRQELVDQRMRLIGKAVTLTFPRAADIARVADCLAEAIADGLELTIRDLPEVTRIIRGRSHGFGRVFLKMLDDFEGLLRDRRYEGIPRHPLWDALWVAFSFGPLDGSPEGPWLFAEPDFPEGNISFRVLVPSGNINPELLGLYPMGYAPGWRLEDSPDEMAAERFLQGDPDLRSRMRKDSPRLAGLVEQGVLLFKPTEGAWLEVVRDRDYEEVRFALVREGPLSDAYTREFGGRNLGTPAPGWVLIAGGRPRPLLDASPDDPLSRLSCLTRLVGPSERKPRLKGGIHYDDSWLGNGFKNPIIETSGVSGVRLIKEGRDSVPFGNNGGFWSLPEGAHFEGTFRVLGESIDTQRSIELAVARFGRGPDRPVHPSPNIQNYLVEGLGGLRSLSARPEYLRPVGSRLPDLSHLFSRTIRLGRDLGEFPSPTDSCPIGWSLLWRGGEWRFDILRNEDASRCTGAECLCPQEVQTERIGDLRPRGMALPKPRTRWRQFLLQAKPLTPCAGKVRSALRRGMEQPANLPIREGAGFRTLPCLQPERSIYTKGPVGADALGLLELRRTVSALTHRRASGVAYSDWIDAVDHFLGKTADPFGILRAWEESGRISVLTQARWAGRRIQPEPPNLVLFRTLAGVHAVATGLWSPEQEEEMGSVLEGAGWMRAHAESIGGLVESLPRWIGHPDTEGLPQFIKEACHRESVGLAVLDADSLLSRWGMNQYDAPGMPIPPSDLIETVSVPGLGMIAKHTRRGAPTFWTVPGTPCWTYSWTFALALLASWTGREPFLAVGAQAIETSHPGIHLPLSLGRLAAWTGPTTPGPVLSLDGTRKGWGYEFPSGSVRDEALSVVNALLRVRTTAAPETAHA